MITGMHPRRVPFEADVQFPAMAAQVLQAARPQTLLRQASQGECLSVIMQPARRARRAGCIPFRPPRAQKVLLCLRVIFEGPVLVSRHKRAAALSLFPLLSQERQSKGLRRRLENCSIPPPPTKAQAKQDSLTLHPNPFRTEMRSERRLNSSFLPGPRA